MLEGREGEGRKCSQGMGGEGKEPEQLAVERWPWFPCRARSVCLSVRKR